MGRVPGVIKSVPEDFVVEEIPAYAPSGEGDHVFIRFRKRGMTTDAAARVIAAALGADARAAGIAGMKDRVAVTTQTISLAPPRGQTAEEMARRAAALSLDGITILDVARHPHKLRTGHLAGNRFTIRIRHVPRERAPELDHAFRALAARGVPNAFGAQRFGREGDNADQAKAWLAGTKQPPRDKRLRRLQFSALQSAVFNAVLARRLERGDWDAPIEGDVLKRHDSGGLFVCTDVQADRERAARGELSPTGPLFGPKMMRPVGDAGRLEQIVTDAIVGDIADLEARSAGLGDGTRRPLRLWVTDLTVDVDSTELQEHPSCVVCFVLSKGAFATTVLDQVVAPPEAEVRDATST